MAMPTWKDTGPNFGSSNAAMQNAQRGFTQAGASAESIVDRYEKEEQNKIANARAQEQLDLQKQQYADQQAAKAAGSKYMADLGRVLESGVVSQADQAKIGTIAAEANAAYDRGDKARYNVLQGQLAELVSPSALKSMSDAYQKDAGAQLQLLRSVVAAPTMDARDRVALLGSIADPLEKKIGRVEDHANRLAEIKEQDILAGIRQQAGFTHSENLAKTANEKENERARTLMSKETYVNSKNELIPGNVYMSLTPEEQKEWVNTSAKKDLLTPKTDKMYGVINDNGTYRIPKEGEKPTELVEASVFNKIVENDEKSTGSALAKTLSEFSSGGMFSTDHKTAATNAANEAGKLLNAANVPLSKANSIINAAVLAAKDKEGTFNKDVFDLAIQQGMLSKGVASSKKDGNTTTVKQDLKPPVVTEDEKARFDVLSGMPDRSLIEQKEFLALEKRLSKIKAEEEKRKIKADQIANIDRIIRLKPQDRTAEDMRIITEGY